MARPELQIANGWTEISDDKERRTLGAEITGWLVDLAKEKNKDKHQRPLYALYTLAGGLALADSRPNTEQITLVRRYPVSLWHWQDKIAAARIVKEMLASSGVNFDPRANPENLLYREGNPHAPYVLVEGALPSPDDVMNLPGMEHLRGSLTLDIARRPRARKELPADGFGYLTFSAEGLRAGEIGIGFGDPTAAEPTGGQHLEVTLGLNGVKSILGFPPPPPKEIMRGMPGM